MSVVRGQRAAFYGCMLPFLVQLKCGSAILLQGFSTQKAICRMNEKQWRLLHNISI